MAYSLVPTHSNVVLKFHFLPPALGEPVEGSVVLVEHKQEVSAQHGGLLGFLCSVESLRELLLQIPRSKEGQQSPSAVSLLISLPLNLTILLSCAGVGAVAGADVSVCA